MILSVGEILYDVFPGYRRMGGAPFNISYHLQKLGAPVSFVSRIGIDHEAELLMDQLHESAFDTTHIQRDTKKQTGEVIVTIDDSGEPVFKIVPDVAYDYIDFSPVDTIIQNESVSLIYFGTLMQRGEYGFATLQKILLSKNPTTKCLYDVNLRPKCYNRSIINASLKHTNVLKMNETELQTIKKLFDARKQSDIDFIHYLINDYDIEMIAITKGASGSELFTLENRYDVKTDRNDNINNSVGAGDAYTAILALGYLCGWHPKKILSNATSFAAGICGEDGALPSSNSFYNNWQLVCEKVKNEKQ